MGGATFTLATGTLPAGLTLATNGTLSGTPTQTGTFPITVKVTDGFGCTGTGPTYNLVIGCQTITVTNPATNSGTAGAPFSQTFTAAPTVGATTFTLASGSLPTGMTLASNGTLSGTPLQTGSFPITVKATDANGCSATGSTYTLTIACQIITVTNPGVTTGTVSSAFSQTFTQSGAIGGATFTTASTLPNGLSLATNGTLSGTPTQTGSFPITVTVTDGNACTGTGGTYTLVIGCQTITVTNPGVTTGTVSTPFSQTFTQTGGFGTTTFSTASTLPTGLTLHSATGVLDGTPTQPGTFPIVVTATDSNGCTGNGATYTLIISCQTITVTNPGVATGPAGTPFSQTFTQSGGVGTTNFSESGALPTGLTFHTATGVLDGTPLQGGTFPIVVTATDSNGCTGSGATYNLVITCPVITVTNPGVSTGTAGTPFSQTFSQSGGVGTITWSETGALPAGILLNSSTGVLSGTTSQAGAFPITVTATDQNGCQGTGATYNLTFTCQTVTVTNPGVNTGTVDAPFSQTFSVSGILGTVTWSETGALPTGLTLHSATGILDGTPTVNGVFPITVKATDTNGCFGTSSYTLTINCQTITVTNPVVNAGTVDAPFSQTFSQTGAHGTATFTLASGALPAGLSLSTAGQLAGTPTVKGVFPITVTVTDSNGCQGTGATYTLTINCQTITVTNPATTTGTTNAPFSEQFTQSGAHGTATFSTASTLPTGFSLDSSTGILSGTTQQHGTFPIVVTVTDSNGCTGTGATYTLVINCQTITVTNPGINTATAGVAFDQQFTASGILGTVSWSETGSLPSGITLDSSTGHLAGTTNAVGTYPITVKATDTNGCFGTSSYTLTVTCPTITITRTGGGSFPAATFNVGYPAGNTFTATGGSGNYHWAFGPGNGHQPPGINLTIVAASLSGIPSATGTFTMTVVVTDQITGCTGQASFPFTIKPNVSNDSYSNLVNNTEAFVTGGTTATPATPAVQLSGAIVSNDTPASGVTVDATSVGTFPTTQGGSVTIATDGTFKYTPPVTASPLSTDSFTYTASSNTGTVPSIVQYAASTGAATATGTVTLNLSNRVWYVKNNAAGGGNGQSQSPFNSLASFTSARVTPDTTSDIIYVYNGNGTTTNQNAGVTLLDNEQLIGEGVALVVNGNTLVAAGTKPQITNAASNGVTLGNGNTVKGLNVIGAANYDIVGISKAGFTADTLTVQSATSGGISLQNVTGTVTITNSTITNNNGVGLDINNGTATITVDNTNSITANATQRSVSIQSRAAAGNAIAIGATITDNGTGIFLNQISNAGGPVSFTGTQNLSTTTNAAVTMTGISGATINFSGTMTINTTSGKGVVASGTNTFSTVSFSGTLSITTTTGAGFDFNGAGPPNGGTLNVTGTADVTTGAAANGVSITGTTIGGSGVTFTSVNTTGATTAISLVNNTGTVAVNGGTLTNGAGTTGASLQGSSTSLSLAGVTISGGSGTTTGITNTTNFGTLTIGSSVSVTAATALNLTTGTVSGTFATLTSTGGVNGISLNTIAGTWGASAGSLSGMSGTALLISGGTESFTYPGNITQNTAGQRTVNISSATGGTITLSGAIGNGAVFLNSNTGATIDFTGVLTLNTGSSDAFTATGGGTVSATNTTSTITSTTGIGINVANTTIGASGLKFKSVSVNGASNGIILNNTGASGGLTILGDGTGTRNNSGGTIQNISGDGVLLTSTLSPSFSHVAIDLTTHHGIKGTLVTNFTFDNGTINHSGINGGGVAVGATNDANISFGLPATPAGTEQNVSGVLSIQNNGLSNAYGYGLDLQQFNGTISQVTISNNTLTSTGSASTSIGSALNIILSGGAGFASSITKGDINNNTVNSFPSAAGMQLYCGNINGSTQAGVGTAGSGTNIVNITGNTFNGLFGTMGMDLEDHGAGDYNFNAQNNSVGSTTGIGFTVDVGRGCGSAGTGACGGNVANVTGTINNVNMNTSNGLTSPGFSIGLSNLVGSENTNAPQLKLNVTNSSVTNNDGVDLLANSNRNAGTMKVRSQSNNFAAPVAAGNRAGLEVRSGGPLASTLGNTTVCTDLTLNTTTGSGSFPGIGLRLQSAPVATISFGIVGLTGGGGSPATEQFVGNGVGGKNPGSANGGLGTNGVVLESATSGFVSCANF